MCRKCSEEGRFELCSACRERTGTGSFPLRRDNWTLGALMRHSYACYRRNLAAVTLAFIIVVAIVLAFNFVGTLVALAFPDQAFIGMIVSAVLFVPQVVLQGALSLGMIAVSLSAARGEAPSVGLIFSQFSRLGAWAIQSLVMYLAVFAAMLPIGVVIGVAAFAGVMQDSTGAVIAGVLLGIPALIATVYVVLGMFFGNFELVHDQKIGALAALKSSWRIASGQRWAIVGCALVMAGLMVVGVLACLIGVVFTLGFSSVLFASLYLALKNGASDAPLSEHA
jgi:hypothetical protein